MNSSGSDPGSVHGSQILLALLSTNIAKCSFFLDHISAVDATALNALRGASIATTEVARGNSLCLSTTA